MAWTTLAYFVAAIPVGVVLARAKGIDLRTVGSGNIGATNAARALGTKLGIDPARVFHTPSGRPVQLVSDPTPIRELMG